MKGALLEPGPKPNSIILAVPDCILQYLGWKEGDYVEMIISRNSGDEALVVTRRPPPGR